jgi:hypothetical protein
VTISEARRRAICSAIVIDASAGNCVISSLAKDFSSVRVNGGKPWRIDSVTFGIDIFKDGLSDSFDMTDSLLVEFNRLLFGILKKKNVCE